MIEYFKTLWRKKWFWIFFEKLANRISEWFYVKMLPLTGFYDSDKEYLQWLDSISVTVNDFCDIIGVSYTEASIVREEVWCHGEGLLRNLSSVYRGGALVDFLYACVRRKRPDIVLETGVALGFSSAAIFKAFEANGQGLLLSSDLPYLGIADSDRVSGSLGRIYAPDDWALFLEGDSKNLDTIVRVIPGKIDLVHYDSDKTFLGKKKFFSRIRRHLSDSCWILMDDVCDNNYFQTLSRQFSDHRAFAIRHKGSVAAGVLIPSDAASK